MKEKEHLTALHIVNLLTCDKIADTSIPLTTTFPTKVKVRVGIVGIMGIVGIVGIVVDNGVLLRANPAQFER